MPESFRSLAAYVSEALTALTEDRAPATLYDPIRYVLEAGGKRLRPIIVLLSAEVFGVERDRALPLALAVELVHNFSLVHDDIMDQSPTRRGWPTVHEAWDTPTAILCGDMLLTMALETVSQSEWGNSDEVMTCIARMMRLLCEGQALDAAYERVDTVTTDEYLHMVDGKTGALLAACFRLGGIAGGASPEVLDLLDRAGRAAGRAFQIQDDLLDLVAEDPGWGKQVGGDLMAGKRTFLLVEACSRAKVEDADFFECVRAGQVKSVDEVNEARVRMANLGVLAAARRAVSSYSKEATGCLLSIAGDTSALESLMQRMAKRAH